MHVCPLDFDSFNQQVGSRYTLTARGGGGGTKAKGKIELKKIYVKSK